MNPNEILKFRQDVYPNQNEKQDVDVNQNQNKDVDLNQNKSRMWIRIKNRITVGYE